jgi:hypothetical protein
MVHDEKDKVMLNELKRKMLREMYGPATEQRVRRFRNDQEMRRLHKNHDLVADIKRR